MSKQRLVSGAGYWDFEENPKFIGTFIVEVHKESDDKLIGYAFASEDGEEFLISNSHAIEKAVNMEIPGTDTLVRDGGYPLEILFKGKTTNSKGQDVNIFTIDLIIPDEPTAVKKSKKEKEE
jgi:hypothetical protein